MRIGATILSLLFLVSCFQRTVMMTRTSFDDIHLGTPTSEVIALAGQPYKIHHLGGRKEEYEYIERINVGQPISTDNHYFLVILEGRVISKRYSQESPPAFDIIYYDNPTLTH